MAARRLTSYARSARSGRTATSSAPTRRDRGGRHRPGRRRGRDPPRARRQSGATCAAILLTHSHYDHFGALADLAEATGAPVWLPEGERDVFRSPDDFFPGFASRAYTGRGDAARGGETVERRGHHVPGARTCPATRRATSPTTPTAPSSPATSSSRARSAAPTCPSATGRRCSSRSARSPTRFPPETVVYSGHGPRDDPRRRARPQPVPRRAPRVPVKLRARRAARTTSSRPSSRSGSG